MQKGITLIETLIYISLLSILMGGVLSSIFMIIDSEQRDKVKSEADYELILEKYHEK